MGEVERVHDAEHQREARSQQKQHEAIAQAVEGLLQQKPDPLQPALKQWRAQRHVLVWHTEHDMAVCIGKACDQAFAHDRANLLFGKVHHGHDLFANQRLGRVVVGNLRAGFLMPSSGPKSTCSR